MYMAILSVVLMHMLALMRLKHGPAMTQADLIDQGLAFTALPLTQRTESSVVVQCDHVSCISRF